ncbi:MAG: RNA-binding S4 domain-containing protein [Clostridia bacterium]
MRIDKYLKVSRIVKRRTVANDAADGGRVEVNGKTVKPSFQLKIGDVVSIAFGNKSLKFKVLSLSEHVKKDDVESMYEVISCD